MCGKSRNALPPGAPGAQEDESWHAGGAFERVHAARWVVAAVAVITVVTVTVTILLTLCLLVLGVHVHVEHLISDMSLGLSLPEEGLHVVVVHVCLLPLLQQLSVQESGDSGRLELSSKPYCRRSTRYSIVSPYF